MHYHTPHPQFLPIQSRFVPGFLDLISMPLVGTQWNYHLKHKYYVYNTEQSIFDLELNPKILERGLTHKTPKFILPVDL